MSEGQGEEQGSSSSSIQSVLPPLSPPLPYESPQPSYASSVSSSLPSEPQPKPEPVPPKPEPPKPEPLPPKPEPRLCGARPPLFSYPYNAPLRSNDTTIEMFSASQRHISSDISIFSSFFDLDEPIAVSIGPYHCRELREMEEAKRAALEEFCRVASQPREVVQQKILTLAGSARSCYSSIGELTRMSTESFADMMLLDGCFLLQFMVSMCPDDPNDPPEADPLMSRAEVHTCIDGIMRDVLLLENQIPWIVLEALMELRPAPVVPVDRFLALLASAFDAGNDRANNPPIDDDVQTELLHGQANHDHDQPPPAHLLGLFHRRQVGAARTRSLHVPSLSSLSSTAVELAEMGVKLKASKTSKFGDMSMSNRRPGLGLFGELSLAPLVFNRLTLCWLLNMAAYEACLGATQADNFAVGSYLSVVAQLMNREEDVKELRAKGIINSAMSDEMTLVFIKLASPDLRVGHRYYHIFEQLQKYKQERWVWIAVHRFFYNNIKTIIGLLSVAGVLAGLFKTILSLKQPTVLG